MEFWGVEVKAGKPLKVVPEEGHFIHLSQASLGESKNKGDDSVPLYVTAKGQKLLLGTLSSENFPQIPFDLVFDEAFEVSHNWKNGSVYLLGYTAVAEDLGTPEFSYSDDDSEEEEIPVTAAENGKPKPADKANAVTVKADPAASQKVTAVEPKKDKKPGNDVEPKKDKKPGNDDDDDEDDGDDDDDEGDSESGSDDDMESGDEDELKGGSDESEESSDEDDEETPKQVASGKKRSKDSASATPIPSKKAKADGPQKTDVKKGGHTATPHPAKQTGKAPAKSPQSGGQFSCKSCSKTFNSENALQSHTKAKHK